MKPIKIFPFIFLFWLIGRGYVNAQQEFGQIDLSAGLGLSPGFNGGMGNGPGTFFQLLPYYPVGTCLSSLPQSAGDLPTFKCNNITPNLGGTLDFGISRFFSLGIASSYQSEVVNWYSGYNTSYPAGIDKITRINLSGRILYHLDGIKQFDPYVGFRIGQDYWYDAPTPYNSNSIYSKYFLNEQSLKVSSIQLVLGLRYFPNLNFGIQAEIGIGSPYLAEGGITFRINTLKRKVPAEENKVQPMSEQGGKK